MIELLNKGMAYVVPEKWPAYKPGGEWRAIHGLQDDTPRFRDEVTGWVARLEALLVGELLLDRPTEVRL